MLLGLAILAAFILVLVLFVWTRCPECDNRLHTIECSERKSLRDAVRTKRYDSAA